MTFRLVPLPHYNELHGSDPEAFWMHHSQISIGLLFSKMRPDRLLFVTCPLSSTIMVIYFRFWVDISSFTVPGHPVFHGFAECNK